MSMYGQRTLLDKIGIPSHLVWGYLGVLFFMMGDGLEIAWLSPYLIDQGFTVQQTSLLFSAYGITIAVSSWFSGVLVEALGAKKAMLIGYLSYAIATVGFVGIGISNEIFSLMVITYALRGFGYPLFGYSFLVWIAYRSPHEKLGTAVGWFWFVFTGGLNVLGAYYSAWAIDAIGYINTLWSALIWVSIGAVFALVINKDKLNRKSDQDAKGKAKELLKGLTIVKKEPKVLLGGIVRTINTTAQFAFPVFLPTYLSDYGIPTTTWLGIWGTIFTSNIIFNLLFGVVGDKIGWRNTVMWFGGVGCGIFTLALFYTPQVIGGNIWVLQVVGIMWGALLAGYVPLSALVPSLVKQDKGAAMAVLNLGAGLPVFVGPAIVGLTIGLAGDAGVIWILAGLYFLSAFLTKFITLTEESEERMEGEAV